MFRSWLAIALLAGAPARAATWEVAAIFLGADETDEYQRDIDRNVLELAQLSPGPKLKLSLYRELRDRVVEYHVDPAAPGGTKWDPLFFEAPLPGVEVGGNFRVTARRPGDRPIVREPEKLSGFLGAIFRDPAARRVLVIYGHGLGPDGLKAAKLVELRRALETAVPARSGRKALDLLWLDSCFMATIEVAHELRGIADLYLASEDAEFSAGAPFDALDALESGPDDVRAVALDLAQRFVESYSYLKKGSQREAVYSGSATVSLVDLGRVEGLVTKLGELARSIGRLGDGLRASLRRSAPRRAMEKRELSDLGWFVTTLKRANGIDAAVRSSSDAVLRALEISRPSRLKTNPRVALRPPRENQSLVFGYEDWSRGYEGDADVIDKLPSNLKPQAYLRGSAAWGGRAAGRAWPSRTVRKRIYVSPFAAGLSIFNAVFVDPVSRRPVSSVDTYVRLSDFAVREAESVANPLLFTGYTQRTGAAGERYTGLAVLEPSLGETGLDYLDTEFARATNWGNL